MPRTGWGRPADDWDRPEGRQPHEAKLLKLDCSKARDELGWRPAMALGRALERVVDWHRAVGDGADARVVSLQHIHDYRAALTARLRENKEWQ